MGNKSRLKMTGRTKEERMNRHKNPIYILQYKAKTLFRNYRNNGKANNKRDYTPPKKVNQNDY